MTLMYPGAVDVTNSSDADPKVPLPGKAWTGGSGKPKLVLHTIEAADPWTIGWPRNWSGWSYAPHLAMNTDRYPDGDWMYQTVKFDKAGYSIRDNSTEVLKYVYQIEIAGQAAKVPDYPDSFYQVLAEVCQWFVDNMGVPDVWADFSCCSYGSTTDCRMTEPEVDAFSGFLGHCHVGYGVDTHGDPGQLDVARVQSFMTQEEDSMAGFYIVEGQVDDRANRLFWVERIQAKLAVLEGGDTALGNRVLIEGAGMLLGVNDAATQALLGKWVNTTGVGPTEDRRLSQALGGSGHQHDFEGTTK